MHFPVHGGLLYRQVATIHAVDGVSFDVKSGETVGLVGESGCGKSTLGKAILRLYDPTAGKVMFEGRDLAHIHGAALRELRR
ncbi:ATP-binding cassette domain-containing protein, partial [bacterium]